MAWICHNDCIFKELTQKGDCNHTISLLLYVPFNGCGYFPFYLIYFVDGSSETYNSLNTLKSSVFNWFSFFLYPLLFLMVIHTNYKIWTHYPRRVMIHIFSILRWFYGEKKSLQPLGYTLLDLYISTTHCISSERFLFVFFNTLVKPSTY